MADTVDVPLRSRRLKRVVAVQKIQHGIPAAGLMFAGLEALGGGARGIDLLLAGVEIVTSVLLLVTIARGIAAARRTDPAHHAVHGTDWADVWSAGVLFAEVWEHWHVTHHVARPILLTAVVTLGLGLLHGRIAAAGARRRSLRVSDTGLYVGGKPFRAFHARLEDVASIAIRDRDAEIRTRKGRSRRIDLDDLVNRAEVREALIIARQRLEAHLKRESDSLLATDSKLQK